MQMAFLVEKITNKKWQEYIGKNRPHATNGHIPKQDYYKLTRLSNVKIILQNSIMV